PEPHASSAVAQAKQVPAAEKCYEEEEIKEQLWLRISRLEDEQPERDDETEVQRDERRQLVREDHAERGEQNDRQANVPDFGDLEELRIGQPRRVKERQICGVDRHACA